MSAIPMLAPRDQRLNDILQRELLEAEDARDVLWRELLAYSYIQRLPLDLIRDYADKDAKVALVRDKISRMGFRRLGD